MKLSANKLNGIVKDLELGPINAKVRIEIAGNAIITAIVARDAVEELGLALGSPACAVIKASSILLGVCQEGTGCKVQT